MKRSICVAMAVVLVLGMSSAAMARGGRGGTGGPRGNAGGGQHGERNADRDRADDRDERQIGNQGARENKLQNNNAQNRSTQNNRVQNNHAQNINVQNQAQQLKSNYAGTARPFTSGWYANHPGAWQYTHPNADAWAVATLAGAAGWLGIPAYTAAEDEAVVDDTVTTADTGEDQADDNGAADDGADDNQDDDQQVSTSDLAAATQLAATGANAAASSADFLPLGVFALAPENQKEAAALLQIAVSKQGIIRGSYYDLLTDQGHPIQGAIDKKTQRVAFTIGNQGKTIFETQLVDLTDSRGEISLHFANGEATDWTLSRYNADPSTGAANE